MVSAVVSEVVDEDSARPHDRPLAAATSVSRREETWVVGRNILGGLRGCWWFVSLLVVDSVVRFGQHGREAWVWFMR